VERWRVVGAGGDTHLNGLMYGVVTDDSPESDANPAPFYLLPFEVVDLRKDSSFRPPGVCFVTVVFKPTLPVPALNLSPDQELSWGGDASENAVLGDMLPFSTAPYHGFNDVRTDRRVGHGAFFATLPEAQKHAAIGFAEVISLV
jgi:hypothetical protein